MITQANNASELAEIFDDLIATCSLHQAHAFLQACWLWPEFCIPYKESFEKMVYIYGKSDEIYTLQERNFIDEFNQKLLYCDYVVNSKLQNVKCKIVISKLKRNTYPLHDAIAFMKIFDKAFNGFNIFLFISRDGIYFGCSCSKNSILGYDCVISPKLIHDMNWEMVYEILLYRKTSPNFYEYYSGILSMILRLPECFAIRAKDDNYCSFNEYNFDNDDFENFRGRNLRYFLYDINFDSSDTNNKFDIEEFKYEVKSCMDDLNYICSKQVNTMELLFKAQDSLLKNYNNLEINHTYKKQDLHSKENHLAELEYIDDPIALIEMMKKEQIS